MQENVKKTSDDRIKKEKEDSKRQSFPGGKSVSVDEIEVTAVDELMTMRC